MYDFICLLHYWNVIHPGFNAILVCVDDNIKTQAQLLSYRQCYLSAFHYPGLNRWENIIRLRYKIKLKRFPDTWSTLRKLLLEIAFEAYGNYYLITLLTVAAKCFHKFTMLNNNDLYEEYTLVPLQMVAFGIHQSNE